MKFETCIVPLSQNVEHHVPDVVAVARVAGPGVTEPDYEKGVVTQLLPQRLELRSPLSDQQGSRLPKRLARRRLGPWLHLQEE